MKCPACANDLTEMKVQDLSVDLCKEGCGGVWFDNWELRKVDEAHEALGEELMAIERKRTVEPVPDQRRDCPRCEGVVMMRHYFTIKKQVEVDTCPKCNGVWLDIGELAKIRDQYPTEESRQRAAQERFDEMFGSQLEAMRNKSQEDRDRARSVARAVRFICPSWYLPGKQRWGAF